MVNDTEQSTELTLQQHAEQELATVEEGITALREKWGGVVFDVETTKGMDQAKAARMEIRQPRYEVQRIVKAKKSELAQISRDLGARGEAIIDQVMEIEGPIHQQIEAVEARKAAEKEARDKRDREERQRQMDRILSMRGLTGTLIGATVDELDAATQQLLADDLSDLDDVYRPDGQMAKDKALEDLAVLRTQRAEAEQLEEELRVLREQQATQEAQLAAERQENDRQRAEREQAERAAAERRANIDAGLNAIRAFATAPGRTVADLTAMRDRLALQPITAETFGDFVAEAEGQRDSSLAALDERIEVVRDLEEARAEAEARQRELDEQAAEQHRREEAEAVERARIAQEAADAEAARQQAEAEERARIQREAEEMAIRQVTVRDAMQSAYEFLVAEGYRDATPTRMLAAALEKTA